MTSEEYIYGLHTITATLEQAPQQILLLYILQGRFDPPVQQLLALAKMHGIEAKFLSRQELDKLTADKNHQGVVAKCRFILQYNESDIEPLLHQLNTPPFILILDGVQDPHNLGACLRTADAAGVHMVIAPKDNSVGLTPSVRKVACGAAESLPFIQVTNLARVIRMLKSQNIWCYGLAGEGDKSIYQAQLTGGLALVMGAEGKGLRRLTRDICDDLLFIPMSGQVESLNVSVATGVCLYEAVRQRQVT